MTHELADAMVAGTKPFGQNMFRINVCEPNELLELNQNTLALVKDRGEDLAFHRDWHLHDGVVSPGKGVTLDEVTDWMRDVSSMPWDERHVFPAINPDSMEWLWRWYIDEFDRNLCSFDFTAPDQLIADLVGLLPKELLAKTRISPCSDLFDPADLRR